MAIRYIKARNLLEDPADVLVCTTNSIGVMGAGIAKMFREQVPGLFYAYRYHCQIYDPTAAVPFVYPWDGRYVFCLHTKINWRQHSTKELVQKSLIRFHHWCKVNSIKSVAMPPPGCGHGGLWFEKDVQPMLEKMFAKSVMDVRIYLP